MIITYELQSINGNGIEEYAMPKDSYSKYYENKSQYNANDARAHRKELIEKWPDTYEHLKVVEIKTIKTILTN